MRLLIQRDALDLVFRTLLSCGCPVTPEEERAIFDLLETMQVSSSLEYSRVLAVFKPNADTVFARLADFTLWQAPTGLAEYAITREHVIRHFASSFHWKYVVAPNLDGAYKKVINIPAYFLAHMLLPARVTEIDGDCIAAVYGYDGGGVRLTNLFPPYGSAVREGEMWAVHFAGLLTRFDPHEEEVATLMAESNLLLVQFRSEVESIDYAHFERYGNYRTVCEARRNTYYGVAG